jgi:hypothetical protein
MSFHYEVIIEPALSELFRRKFLSYVGRTRCCEMFKLMSPGMPNLWEFKTGKDIFTLSFSEEPGEQMERLSVDSMTLDMRETIMETVKSGLMEYLMPLLAPLSPLPRPELENKINELYGNLEKAMQNPHA